MIKIVISLIPVFLLLFLLLFLDSLKLVRLSLLISCLCWGILSAMLCLIINTWLLNHIECSFNTYSGFIAPVVEEGFKMIFILILMKRNRIGFLIDGAIYGFAVGAAFAFSENIFYLFHFAGNDGNLTVWIIRGFGTAVMHGGTTAIFGILCMGASNRKSPAGFNIFLGLCVAALIHGGFNQFFISPLITTVFIIFGVPLTIVIVFRGNEKSIRNWMELEFDSEVSLLRMIRHGHFTETKSGIYLQSIKHYFPAETVMDIYCFIQLHLELSMKAKSYIMLKENDLEILPDPDIPNKLKELKALRHNIGRTGLLAISPVFRMSEKDLWKLSLLPT